MEPNDALYKAFLAELESLEKFRMGYSALHPAAPLDREDPDVRRLTEALALFSARTRLASQRAVARSTQRLFQQHFPYVLGPVPAMAMLQAVPATSFVDTTELPRGTRFLLTPQGTEGRQGPLSFRTLAPLRILPLRLRQLYLMPRGVAGARLLLEFESHFPRNDTLGTLSLYVNYLNELLSSLAVHHHLKKTLRAASVFFDERITEEAQGQPCEVRFGAPPTPASQVESFDHPLQSFRTFCHFPQQELFMSVSLPVPPRNWRRFTLCLDLGARWPKDWALTPETFVLHAVPAVNLQRQMSNPLEHDGTKEHHSIQHPEPGGGYRVHSVLGVYQMEGQGLVPLRPSALSGGAGTYELEHEGQGPTRKTRLTLNQPGAFSKPVRVAMEAWWYQPLSPDAQPSSYRVGLAERFLEGLAWSTVGAIIPSRDSRLEHDSQGLLQLLSIRNQRFLQLEDLGFLLDALGVNDERYFRPVAERLSSVEVRSMPFAKSATGFKYLYQLTLSELAPLLVPTLDLFAARLLELLRAWSTEEVVELEVKLPHLDQELHYPAREAAQ